MLALAIPGFKDLCLEHLVLDYNGTLACDGRLLPGVRERLVALAAQMQLHLLTADTFGSVRKQVADLPVTIHIIPGGGEAEAKAAYVGALGPGVTAAVGNGRNDSLMLEMVALGVAVLQQEGAAWEALRAAAVVVPDILAALDLFLHPQRLTATLRR